MGVDRRRVLAFGAMVGRVLLRERDLRRLPEEERAAHRDWAFLGHGADMLALSLVIAPLVWAHHYVMALPLCVYAIGTVGERRRPLVVGLVACMMLPPTFDVWPWSYHRIACLIGLLAVTWPRGQVGFAAGRSAPASATAAA